MNMNMNKDILETTFENLFALLPKDLNVAVLPLPIAVGTSVGILVVMMLFWSLVRHRRYVGSLPNYSEIPDATVHRMATKSQLKELTENGVVDIVIIGSGMGALTTASIMSKCGYKVVVLEQHATTIGGSTQTYRRQKQDYDFDVGVHYVGGKLDQWSSIFRLLYNFLSDGKLQWNRIAESYDVAYNQTTGERLEFTGEHAQNRQTLLKHFGHISFIKKSLDRYYKKCRRARAVAYFSWALKSLPPWMTKVVWNNLGYGKLYKRICTPTTLQAMRDCGLPDEVIGCITYCYGDYGTTPAESPFFIQAFMDNHYEGGAFFPQGGSTSIAKTLVAAIQRRGGIVLANAKVEKILTKAETSWLGRRRHKAFGVCVKGVDIFARTAVISNAGFSKTFEIDPFADHAPPLVSDLMASSDQLALVHKKDRLTPMLKPGHAFVYLFVGLEGTDQDLGLPGQNIWHLKDWNHDQSLHELLDETDQVQDMTNQEPPLVFLSNESAKDPDFTKRHPNKSTVTIIAWTKVEWWCEKNKANDWAHTTQGNRGTEYEQVKQELTNKLLSILYLHFPKTEGHVAIAEMGTPLSANKYLGRGSGEIYNLDHTVGRFDSLDAQRALHPETTIQNLYLCGQDAVAVSIEGAVMSGVFCAARISTLAFFWIFLPSAVGWLSLV